MITCRKLEPQGNFVISNNTVRCTYIESNVNTIQENLLNQNIIFSLFGVDPQFFRRQFKFERGQIPETETSKRGLKVANWND